MTDDLVKMARERANAGGYYSEKWDMLADRIEQLEAALRNVTDTLCYVVKNAEEYETIKRARKALEGKDD
jgi:prefoldin subunit 5